MCNKLFTNLVAKAVKPSLLSFNATECWRRKCREQLSSVFLDQIRQFYLSWIQLYERINVWLVKSKLTNLFRTVNLHKRLQLINIGKHPNPNVVFDLIKLNSDTRWDLLSLPFTERRRPATLVGERWKILFIGFRSARNTTCSVKSSPSTHFITAVISESNTFLVNNHPP